MNFYRVREINVILDQPDIIYKYSTADSLAGIQSLRIYVGNNKKNDTEFKTYYGMVCLNTVSACCGSLFLSDLLTWVRKEKHAKKNAMSALVLPITRRCCLYFIC